MFNVNHLSFHFSEFLCFHVSFLLGASMFGFCLISFVFHKLPRLHLFLLFFFCSPWALALFGPQGLCRPGLPFLPLTFFCNRTERMMQNFSHPSSVPCMLFFYLLPLRNVSGNSLDFLGVLYLFLKWAEQTRRVPLTLFVVC